MKKNTRIDMQGLKEIELKTLKTFRDVCDKNNLRYYLVGGTLLGAVKFKGFIPWDDDIDVSMPRKDYEKLIELYNNEEVGDTKLLSYRNNKEIYVGFAKIVNTRTTLTEAGYIPVNGMGVFIDVFPLDIISNSIKEQKVIMANIQKKKSFLYLIQADKLPRINIIKYFLKMTVRGVLGIVGHSFVLKRMDAVAKRDFDKETNNIVNFFGAYKEKEIANKKWFEEITMLNFEDDAFACPKGYHEYLTQIYGDYMPPLPDDKKNPRHGISAFWR